MSNISAQQVPDGARPEGEHVQQIIRWWLGLGEAAALLLREVRNDAEYALDLRNKGTGGKHQRIRHSSGSPTLFEVTDGGSYSLGGFSGQLAMVAFAVSAGSEPGGWLLCDGRAVSRTTFAALFAALGTAWGAGDGSTTFNLPDLRDAVPGGVGSTFLAVGGSYGSNGSVTLTGTADMTKHRHGAGSLGGEVDINHNHPSASVTVNSNTDDFTFNYQTGGDSRTPASGNHSHGGSVDLPALGATTKSVNVNSGNTGLGADDPGTPATVTFSPATVSPIQQTRGVHYLIHI